MGNHAKSGKSARLNRIVAVGAIAGCTAGFGAIFSAATAQADDCSWFCLDGSNSNNTLFGSNGNGNTTQIGNFNGNIMNNQLNVPILSPVAGVTTTGGLANGGVSTGGLGTNLATAVAAPVTTPIDATLALNPNTVTQANVSPATSLAVGGAATAIEAALAAQVPIGAQIPIDVQGAGVAATPPGQNTQQNIGAPNNETNGAIGPVQALGTAGAATSGGNSNGAVTSGPVTGGAQNTNVTNNSFAKNGAATGGASKGGDAQQTTNVNAGGNQANNSSNNNVATGNGNNSSNGNNSNNGNGSSNGNGSGTGNG